MTDVVYVKIFYTSGTDKTLIKEFTYSVQTYCHNKITSGNSGDTLVTLCKTALDYGAWAQNQFNYRTTDLANATYSMGSLNEVPDTVTKASKVGTCEGIDSAAATLILGSEVSLKFKFKMSEGYKLQEGYTLSAKDQDGNAVELTSIESEGDNTYSVKIKGIGASSLYKAYIVNVVASENEGMTITYGPYSYAFNKQGSSDPIGSLSKALYVYGEAARNYFE